MALRDWVLIADFINEGPSFHSVPFCDGEQRTEKTSSKQKYTGMLLVKHFNLNKSG